VHAQACEVCGEVVHDGCARKALPDCRPVAAAAAAPAHHWLPAGVVHYESDVRPTSPCAGARAGSCTMRHMQARLRARLRRNMADRGVGAERSQRQCQ